MIIRTMKKQILILGGSNEGFILAEKLHAHQDFSCISSLAGRTSIPRKPAGPFRTGGFGGIEGLATYIKEQKIDAIIDATHPFARVISKNAAIAASMTNCPIAHIWRAPWQKQPGDIWIECSDMQQAANLLTEKHSPCFLTIGRLELSAFQNRKDISFLTRAIEPANKSDPHNKNTNTDNININQEPSEDWPDNFSFIYAKGPFTYEDEYKLITDRNIKAIVTKNSGGEKASAKLDVARALQLPVFIINRPEKPDEPNSHFIETANEALDWLQNQ